MPLQLIAAMYEALVYLSVTAISMMQLHDKRNGWRKNLSSRWYRPAVCLWSCSSGCPLSKRLFGVCNTYLNIQRLPPVRFSKESDRSSVHGMLPSIVDFHGHAAVLVSTQLLH